MKTEEAIHYMEKLIGESNLYQPEVRRAILMATDALRYIHKLQKFKEETD